MNKIYIYAIVLGLSIISCDDFLTRTPGNKIDPKVFFSSEKELALYANSFYEKDLPSANEIAEADGITDIIAVVTPNKYLVGNYSDADQGGWGWSVLRNINYFIERADVSPVEEKAKKAYLGVARYWRAHFYFEKVKTFGDVPWYETCLNNDDEILYKARDSRDLVMKKMLEDLNYAIEWCSDGKDETATRVTKYTALALKSRICLHEGTYRKYHTELGLNDCNFWLTQAAQAANELMASKKYELLNTGNPESDYRTLFTSENIAGVSSINKEVILAQVYDASLQRFNELSWDYNSGTKGARWSLARPFVNTYLMKNGERFTDKANYDAISFVDEMQNRDCRLAQTIRTPGYTRISGDKRVKVLPELSITLNGYHILKWSSDNTRYDIGKGVNVIPVIRYAEVLLNYAEAKAELGEFSSDVWNKTIKLLRERAGVDGKEPLVADAYLQSAFYPEISDKYLLEVRRERAVEFVVEGRRYDDLMRWKHGDLLTSEKTKWTGIYVPEVNKGLDLDGDGKSDICFYIGSKPGVSGVVFVALDDNLTVTDLANKKGNLVWAYGANVQRKWEDKKYLRPIPRNVRVVNPGLAQNPGWE